MRLNLIASTSAFQLVNSLFFSVPMVGIRMGDSPRANTTAIRCESGSMKTFIEPRLQASGIRICRRSSPLLRGPHSCDQVSERGLALVERFADHHAGNTGRTGERGHVLGSADATAGDGGDYLRDGSGPFEGGS